MSFQIQVSGIKCFSQERWREAILYYLFGIWCGFTDVVRRPKICFGSAVLRLNQGNYYAYGERKIPMYPYDDEGKILALGCEEEEVEIGLIRFVKNDRFRWLTIQTSSGSIWFHKGTKRSEYMMGCFNVSRELAEGFLKEDAINAGMDPRLEVVYPWPEN